MADLEKRGLNWHEPRELTEEEQDRFLEIVEKQRGEGTFSVRLAAQEAGVHRADVKLTREKVEEFDERYRDARGYGVEAVMNSMVKLGIIGVDEPVVSAGKVVSNPDGTPMMIRKYDSRAAIELFKALTPDGKAALAGRFGIEINANFNHQHEIQGGVTFAEVLSVLQKAGKAQELEAPADTAEVVDVRDEPV